MNRFAGICLPIFLVLLGSRTAYSDDGERKFFGIYMQGNHVGYETYAAHSGQYGGRAVKRVQTHTMAKVAVSGREFTVTADWDYWIAADGTLLRADFTRRGADVGLTIEAVFGSKSVHLKINAKGRQEQADLPLPDGRITEDPDTCYVSIRPDLFSVSKYFLDPETRSFQAFELHDLGETTILTGEMKSKAHLIQVSRSGENLRLFFDTAGDLVKRELDAYDTQYLAEPKEIAMGNRGQPSTEVDLEWLFAIPTDSLIADTGTLTELRFRLTGADLSGFPSDSGQTVSKDGDGWIVDIHPASITGSSAKVVEYRAKVQFEKWLQPQKSVPSNSGQFRELAEKITVDCHSITESALEIRRYVHRKMTPDPLHIALEDASEILKTKRGMCGNYVILTATLLRAAGIPTRLVCGLECDNGAFYYHGWCEIWNGADWIGIDSTADEDQLSASHFKFAEFPSDDSTSKYAHFGKPKIQVLSKSHERLKS